MNSGLIIQNEINNFYNILGAAKVLNENSIILEFDTAAFKEKLKTLFDKVVARAKAILKWIKEKIIDKVIAHGKAMWNKLTGFDKAEEQVEQKIEEVKKDTEAPVEVKEKVKTIEEEIAEFLDEKVNVDLLEDSSPLGKLMNQQLGYWGFSKVLKSDVLNQVTEGDNRKVIIDLFRHYNFEECFTTRRALHDKLKTMNALTKFMEKGYEGKIIEFAKEIEERIKELEDKKKKIENKSLSNGADLSDIADKQKDLDAIAKGIESYNNILSMYYKILAAFTKNYNNVIKAKGEYTTFFNKMKIKMELRDKEE